MYFLKKNGKQVIEITKNIIYSVSEGSIKMTYPKMLIEVALPLKAFSQRIDSSVVLCDTESTSPRFLREAGARRPTAASAYLTGMVGK